jgi:hypothetical protein
MIDTICPCFLNAFYDLFWVAGIVSDERASPAEDAAPSGPYLQHEPQYIPPTPALPLPRELQHEQEEPQYTCPFLKQKAAEQKAGSSQTPDQGVSVLDNIEKLEKARKIYRKAERLRKADEVEKACRCYEQVQHLCPGSRYERLATGKLQKLSVQRAAPAERGASTEEEATPPKEEEPDNQPRSQETLPLPKADTPLLPALPPIDPKVVDALEKILAASAEPGRAQLVIQQEEAGIVGAVAEPVNTTPHWSSDPSRSAPPSVLREVASGGDSSEEDEATYDDLADQIDDWPTLARDWTEVMREGIETLKGGACPEIEPATLERLTVVAEREVGNLVVTMIADSDGVYRGLVVGLRPEDSGDLRAAQRAHNDRILQWIDSMNRGLVEEPTRPVGTGDDEPDDDLDAGDMEG